MPAANQLGQICRHVHSSLTQLVPVSPVPLESLSADSMSHQAHEKARIVVWCALLHVCGSLTHAFSQWNAMNILNYLRALPAALLMPAGWQVILRGLLSGAAPRKSPVKQHSSHRTYNQFRSGGRYLSLICEQTGSGANL